ncbi:hypothetical protein H6P81_000345 [Aristolochia fimbriata]|uniref:Glycosyltransferase n=1 Tax=Aristolochia fimbriata TaxID=158543 RepID=A0AAV7F7S5_ARIFI|nr:hypothetical protein H6P81_000345 [Aristolochia fimbriata]
MATFSWFRFQMGMPLDAGRNQSARECITIFNSIPTYLEKLINDINEHEEDKISCLIADVSMGSALAVGQKLGIPKVAFLPAAAGVLAMSLHIPKLIEAGFIDANGAPVSDEMIKLSAAMPEMNPSDLVWNCFRDPLTKEAIFQFMVTSSQTVEQADWVLFNSFSDIDSWAFDLIPCSLPIGPLISEADAGDSPGLFSVEDPTSLDWLDQHPPSSVIYAAFGSTSVLSQTLFQELALGLELTGRPFLWVVRHDFVVGGAAVYPDGFQARVVPRGKLVSWAPLHKVLTHPSIACFMSHCGWNSTIEGLSNGVPFICLPYAADQFINQSYICDVWKVGLQLRADDNGIITREKVRETVELLLSDQMIGIKAKEIKEQARRSITEGGYSLNNFNGLVEGLLGRQYAED